MDLFTEEQKITLNFQKGDNMVEMLCTVEKVFDDRLQLILPQYFMRYINFLQVGKKMTVKAFSKLGTVDFNSLIISSPLEEHFLIEMDYNSIKLTPGSEIPVVKAMEIMEISKPEGVSKYKTFELSTEYLKFYSDKKFNLNESVEGRIILPKDYGIIKFKAEITEIDPVFDNELTATYVTMTETDRQTLLYYMYIYSKDTD